MQSSRLQRALAECGSNSEFRDGVAPLESLGIRTSFKTIQRVAERVGAEVAEAQHGAMARASAPSAAPQNKPELLVMLGDGLRVRERVEDGEIEKTDELENPPADAEDGISQLDRDNGWRECKVGVVSRMRRGRMKRNGEYLEPETQVQTCLATMCDIRIFSEKLRAEAERRGLRTAKEVVAVSDAGHGLPEMWRDQFAGLLDAWILDFHHVSSRLAHCASTVAEPGAPFARLFGKWKELLYQGEIDKLLRQLTAHAKEHASRPKKLRKLAKDSPGRILWTHIFYIEKYREHMDYAYYRSRGWPIASGHVEALAKQIGVRMKAASKRWTPIRGSEAMANLIADRASQDGRWENRWPAQVYSAASLQPS
jgi:hypothetical protein